MSGDPTATVMADAGPPSPPQGAEGGPAPRVGSTP